MRILVTGATGFLGGALARRLMAQGHEVVALGRSHDKLAKLAEEGAKPVEADLSSSTLPPDIPCDAAIHCAALSSPWGRDLDFLRANVFGTKAALQLARRGGAKRFVHISTPSVYFRFQDQIGVPENMPLPAPVNAYARTKATAEQLALAAIDLDPIIIRPRGIYGEGDTTLLPRLLHVARKRPLPLMNGGRAATDLTHIDDAVDAICVALSCTAPLQQRIFNVSGGVALNVRDVAEQVGKRAGTQIRWQKAPAGAVMAYARTAEAVCRLLPGYPEPPVTTYAAALFAFTQTLNISAAKAQLGWSPRVDFAEGLDRTFAGKAT
ncbi:MAG: NAD(P)-dependent oxidoreductase [Hyphomonadaceae bacterium]|nr:NAD(P)-dependent oxidoreductase [Hyphomonadaceae bacterium]